MEKQFKFNTHNEATAFIEGIEYVNDSSIEINTEPKCDGTHWIVTLIDNDED